MLKTIKRLAACSAILSIAPMAACPGGNVEDSPAYQACEAKHKGDINDVTREYYHRVCVQEAQQAPR